MQNNRTTTVFTDYEKFAEIVGIIEVTETLQAINAPPGFDESGSYDTDRLNALRDFCHNNPRFHIVTITTESDEAEAMEYENTFPDWQQFSEEKRTRLRELVLVSAVVVANCVRIINRLDYFLAEGEADSQITVSEVKSYAKEFSEMFWVCKCDLPNKGSAFIQPYRNKFCTSCQTARAQSRN